MTGAGLLVFFGEEPDLPLSSSASSPDSTLDGEYCEGLGEAGDFGGVETTILLTLTRRSLMPGCIGLVDQCVLGFPKAFLSPWSGTSSDSDAACATT